MRLDADVLRWSDKIKKRRKVDKAPKGYAWYCVFEQ